MSILIGLLIGILIILNGIVFFHKADMYWSFCETPGPITLGELLIPGALLARVVPLMFKAFETPVSEIKFKRGKNENA